MDSYRNIFTKVFIIMFCALIVFSGTSIPTNAQGVPFIKAVVVRGNENIDTALIEKAITKTVVDSRYSEENIKDDLDAIYALGYFAMATAHPSWIDGGVMVAFEVTENPVVTEVVFQGSKKITLDDYLAVMETKSGEVLNIHALFEDIDNLPNWVLDNHGVSLRPVNLNVSEDGIVEIQVAEAIIQDILIDGNEKTKDHVILRELTFQPGDVVDLNEINRSLRNVLMLGYFDEVSFSASEGDTIDDTILTLHVTERKTGNADFGIGYSSRDGVFGYTDISEENFLGNGQRVNFYFEIGKGHRAFKVGFYEPYIDKSGLSFGANAHYTKTEQKHKLEEDGDTESEEITGNLITTGGDITIGRRFGNYSRASLTMRLNNNKYVDGLEQYKDDYRSLTFTLGALTNTTDHPFYPTEGFINTARFELGTRLFGGEAVYSKFDLEHSRYYGIKDSKFVFAFRGRVGRLLSGTLRNEELYRLGGSETLRGYDYGGEGLVGDKLALFNAEFRFPIFERVYGVFFADLGKVWDYEDPMSLSEMVENVGYGAGLRVDTPLGLFRFDYGIGQDDDDQRQGKFYFGIGQTF